MAHHGGPDLPKHSCLAQSSKDAWLQARSKGALPTATKVKRRICLESVADALQISAETVFCGGDHVNGSHTHCLAYRTGCIGRDG